VAARDERARSLPLRLGAVGPAVRDLVARLRDLGDELPFTDQYDDEVARAVERFQQLRGLPATGVCDHVTWTSLIEAGYHLGDRLLVLTDPMMRGDDVAELQFRLGGLGFDAGRVDGIFGPNTQRAVGEFQQDTGLVTDQVAGPETIAALRRLQPRGGTGTIAGVRERIALRGLRADQSARIAVCHLGDLRPLVGSVAAGIQAAGPETSIIEAVDWSSGAAAVNHFEATACLAIEPFDGDGVHLWFFETPNYSSHGGRALAEAVAAALPVLPKVPLATVAGMQMPILRETHSPTVLVRLGRDVVADGGMALAPALILAVGTWTAGGATATR
jgi:N-acetylmuramoyl-L-alanine amidase